MSFGLHTIVLWTTTKHVPGLLQQRVHVLWTPALENQSQSPGRQQLLGHFCGLTNNPPRGTVTHVCHGAICATLDAAFCVHHSTALHILQCFHALVCATRAIRHDTLCVLVSYDTWHRYNDVTTSLNINACQLHCQCNNFLCVCDRYL